MTVITNPNGLVTVQGLNETAKIIRPELIMYPMTYLGNEFARAGIELIGGIQNKLTQYDYRRKGGLMKPYRPGMTASRESLGKMFENELEVFLATGIHKDNIQNYKQNVIGPMSLLGTNKTYKNPAEHIILMSLMATWAEDLLDMIWHGKRNPSGENKYDLADGYYTRVMQGKIEGRISVANKNLIPTGALASTGPDDTSVFYAIESFLTRVHPVLGRRPAILNVPVNVANDYQLAAAAVFKNTLEYDDFGLIRLRNHPNVRMYANPSMGYGDFIQLTAPDVAQLGFDSLSDDETVLVRNIDDDANEVTFNIQARYGMNYRSFDPKVFAVNDGELFPIEWSGDIYDQDHTVTGTSMGNGTVSVNPQKDTYKKNEEVAFTATPSAGFVFDSWSDGSTSNPITKKVLGNTALAATFKPE